MIRRSNRPTTVTDAPEHRDIPLDRVELRAGDGNELTLTGYASTFEPYEMYGGPAQGGWIEQLDPKAFDKTLREKPDLMLLINHQGMPLARTKSGTLTLSVDSYGLKVVAKLDRNDPDVKSLEVKMKRKDMDEMSFAFRVAAQKWSKHPDYPGDEFAHRLITEVNLHKGDVSVVNYGANPTTSAEVKGRSAGKVSKMGNKGRSLREIEASLRREPKVTNKVAENAARLLSGPTRSRVTTTPPKTKETGDALIRKALRLLETYHPVKPGPPPSVAPNLRSATNRTVAMEIPSIAQVVSASEDRRRAERLRANPPQRRANNVMASHRNISK